MQFFVRPLAAVITFTLAIMAVLYFSPLPKIPVVPEVMLPAQPERLERVSPSDLLRDPAYYNGRMVEVTAVALYSFEDKDQITLHDGFNRKTVLRGVCLYDGACGTVRDATKYSDIGAYNFIVTGRFVAETVEVLGTRVGLFSTPVLEVTRAEPVPVKPVYQQLDEVPTRDERGGGYSGGADAPKNDPEKNDR